MLQLVIFSQATAVQRVLPLVAEAGCDWLAAACAIDCNACFFDRRCLDSLAALTILFRLNQEHGQKEWAWDCAVSIFRVLLLLWPWLAIHLVDMKIFKIYVERVFNHTTLDGKQMELERYDYPTRALLLQMLADELKECFAGQRERKMPHFYALQVLDSKFQTKAVNCFQIPVRGLGDECSEVVPVV